MKSKYFIKGIGIVQIVYSVLLLGVIGFYLVRISQEPNGYFTLFLFLFSLYSLALVGMLFLIYLLIGVLVKWKNMTFYTFTYIGLLVINVALLLITNFIHTIS